MKTLEMINEEIKYLKNDINLQKQLLEKVNKEDIAYTYIKLNIYSLEFRLERLYKIRKDLEAFEIIKEHSKIDYILNTNINDLGKDYYLFICEINSVENKEEYDLIKDTIY